ncbi:MAG: DUF6635 family protein [Gammaproteobacteria bacterium]
MPSSDRLGRGRQSPSPGSQLSNEQRQLILKAVNAGIEDYIQSRKEKVPDFVARHFSFKGALKLHRKALGKDLYKGPLNILWLAPLAAIKVSSWILNKAGAGRMARRLDSLPAGFQTDVQKEINWLIYTELLELPYQQASRTSTKDALLEAILRESSVAGVIDDCLTEIHEKSTDPDFCRTVENNLKGYATSRTAAAELAGNIITLSSSYIAFNRALPGVLTTGSAAAAAIAEKIAIAKFWLGSTLGAWYYSLFPVAASAGLVIASTGAIIAGLGLIVTFTGIITDPLQAKLGLHQKRLYQFIDALGGEMRYATHAEYNIKELYAARVMDILDLLMTALSG